MINAGTVAAYLTLDTSSFDAGIDSAMLSISDFSMGSAIFKSAVDNIESLLSSAGRFFTENFANPASTAASTVISSVGSVASKLTVLPAAAASTMSAFITSWSGIPSAINSSRAPIASACSGIVGSVSSALRKMPPSAYSIMVQVGQGMVSGLAATQNSVFAKAKTIANTVAAKMRSALGIHSPSRVMREIGRFTVEGMALGMGDNIDKLREQASSAANIAADALTVAPPNLNYASTARYPEYQADGVAAYDSGLQAKSRNGSMSELAVVADKLDRCIRMMSGSSTSLEIDGRSFGRLIREYS